MRTRRRPTNHKNGLLAEALCRAYLRLHGWRILSSRYKCSRGEIDIIARRGRMLAMVEVKARSTQGDALAAVSPRQWLRIHDAANDFLAHNQQLTPCDVRFDVMAVASLWPTHIRDAWRPSL